MKSTTKVTPEQIVTTGKHIKISTVKLMIEHPGGMWFETCVFGGSSSAGEVYQRYKTLKEAAKGHIDCVIAHGLETDDHIFHKIFMRI